MSLRKALRIISAFIAGVMCVSMCAFGVITERDLWIRYRCSFDINADRFSIVVQLSRQKSKLFIMN